MDANSRSWSFSTSSSSQLLFSHGFQPLNVDANHDFQKPIAVSSVFWIFSKEGSLERMGKLPHEHSPANPTQQSGTADSPREWHAGTSPELAIPSASPQGPSEMVAMCSVPGEWHKLVP